MKAKQLIYLQACCNNLTCKMVSAEAGIKNSAKDFNEWVRMNNLCQKDLWYADFFDAFSKEYIGSFEIEEDKIYAVYDKEKEFLTPSNRKIGFKKKIQIFIKDTIPNLFRKKIEIGDWPEDEE